AVAALVYVGLASVWPVTIASAAGDHLNGGRGGEADAVCSTEECQVGARVRVPGSHGQGSQGSSSSGRALSCLYFATEAATAEPAMSLDVFSEGDTVWVRCWTDEEMMIP